MTIVKLCVIKGYYWVKQNCSSAQKLYSATAAPRPYCVPRRLDLWREDRELLNYPRLTFRDSECIWSSLDQFLYCTRTVCYDFPDLDHLDHHQTCHCIFCDSLVHEIADLKRLLLNCRALDASEFVGPACRPTVWLLGLIKCIAFRLRSARRSRPKTKASEIFYSKV